MKIKGIGIDYSNICKDYNTVYLDRDNSDPATRKCMNEVLAWSEAFLKELLENFSYGIYNLSSDTPVAVEDVASKRFLFYSLEKEITLQSYVLHDKYIEYPMLSSWEMENNGSILIQNDEDGGSIYLFMNEGSMAQKWIEERLSEFSLDDVAFEAK